MIGAILDGRYRVLRRLGEGGMGEVYLAEHLALGRKEALKVLRPELAAEPAFVSRFRREARATNRVQHPNIVGVHDFGQLPDGRFYLSTEYADGVSLDAVLRQHGALPLPRALLLLHQLADAVAHAHDCGVIHRDLKPENLMLIEHRGRADHLKVLDFGIAKIIAPGYRETVGITTQGDVFGTVEYMSPEQIAGNATDPRIDLYAIGCIAYELVVGEQPFTGRAMQVMHRHVTEAPPVPSQRRPEARLPPAFDALVARCLAKRADQRYQSARELMLAIQAVPGYDPRRAPSGRRRIDPTTLAGFADPSIDDATVPGEGGAPLEEARSQTEVPAGPAQGGRVVRELAEALVDLGVRDLRLSVGVTSLAQFEDDLDRIDAELERLEQGTALREQHAREQDATLRFNAGELAYARSQARAGGERVPPEIDLRLRELDERLARGQQELEAELRRLADRAIGLAAARARIEDQGDALARSLFQLCQEHLPRFDKDARLSALASLYQRLDERARRGQR